MSNSTTLHKFIAIMCGKIELALTLNVPFDSFYYKFYVLLKFFNLYHTISLCLLPFVMPNKLKLYYLSIYCCECLKTFVLSAPSLIRYQLFFTLRPQNILNWFWIYLVHAKGHDPNFSVKGLLASILRAILFLTILWCSWLGIPLCHLFGR